MGGENEVGAGRGLVHKRGEADDERHFLQRFGKAGRAGQGEEGINVKEEQRLDFSPRHRACQFQGVAETAGPAEAGVRAEYDRAADVARDVVQ